MKLFNAIQIVTLLVVAPVVLPLLRGATFWGAGALLYILAAAWLGLFFWTIEMVYRTLRNDK